MTSTALVEPVKQLLGYLVGSHRNVVAGRPDYDEWVKVLRDANLLAAPVTRTLLLVGVEAPDVIATWSQVPSDASGAAVGGLAVALLNAWVT